MIVVTGPTGFLGRAFLEYLDQLEVGRDEILLITNGDVAGYRTLRHDNYHLAESIPSGSILYHFASWIPKVRDQLDSFQALDNPISLANLLGSVSAQLRFLIYISTIDVYSGDENPVTEETRPNPRTLYGSSKLFSEHLARVAARDFGFGLQILRLGHLYGRGEEAYQKLIPSTIRRLREGKAPVLTSDGTEKRTFLHVKDCSRFIWELSRLEPLPKLVNVVGGREVSVRELVLSLVLISGKDVDLDFQQSAGAAAPSFDISYLRRLVGDQEIDLLEGLKNEYCG